MTVKTKCEHCNKTKQCILVSELVSDKEDDGKHWCCLNCVGDNHA